MEGRRARLRAHLFGEIRAAALDELRRTGAASLSLREVAKAAGISPSGMYRYVDGRDGLLELLISDGFESFGSAIEEAISAADDAPVAQIEAVAIAYRRWAIDNPELFGLILGTPVPGFRAGDDGPTVDSARRFGTPMIRVVAAAYAAGRSAAGGGPTGPPVDLSGLDPAVGLAPAALLSAVVRGWARIHGLVTLELFGHLRWSNPDVEVLLRTEARAIATELGCLPAPAPTAAPDQRRRRRTPTPA